MAHNKDWHKCIVCRNWANSPEIFEQLLAMEWGLA